MPKVGLIFLLIGLVATQAVEARGERHKPTERVPENWVHDYDYQSDFESYLKEKAAEGKKLGKPVYLYMYADWCSDCKNFRIRAEKGSLKELLDSRMIVMLDFDYINLRKQRGLFYVPALVKLRSNGTLGSYIHPEFSMGGTRSQLNRALKGFFDENDDT